MDSSVNIGTHKLHIYCTGTGSPAVVIDVGAGESYTSWQSVQEQLAQDTRVCAYDRAGYGQSEPGPLPRDSQTAAGELHQLLLNSGEEGPFLLVGHSLGGLNMQVFAATYPEQVMGLVLLDPSPLGWMMGQGFPELRELFIIETAAMRAEAGAARASSDPERKAQSAFWEALASEHEAFFAQTAQQVGAISSFGQLPLTVIGATEPDPRFGQDSAAFRQFWNDESQKLAAKSERGRFILAEGSSHHIHLDAPQLVMDAIHETLLESGPSGQSFSPGACSSFCLDNGDHCVFGTNLDNTIERGLLFINQRHVLKTTWDPSASGEYARWISRYGSVTVNLVGYQMAWAGMNEAGLMMSTMSLGETEGPTPDERPPFEGPFWMQYQLDNHSTVDQVLASDAQIRLVGSTVDHYLVCDRTGACATIEFLDGQLVAHTGASLPVKALTNSTYRESVGAWEQGLLHEAEPKEESLPRFARAADRVVAFEPAGSDHAISYAFETLDAVSRHDTVWSFVFDPANLRLHFRTNRNPRIRTLDLAALDYACRTPVVMLDVHADLSGDVGDQFTAYAHEVGLDHILDFFAQYEGMSLSPLLVDVLVRGLERFPCAGGDALTEPSLERYRPLLPVPAIWAGLALWDQFWPVWVFLVVLSLAILIWRMAVDQPASSGRRLAWVLVTIVLGPFGLLAYLLARRKRRRVVEKI